ncbi:hypothetical protein Poli38472_010225 [Pythium oligandrum]|uniref:Calmodulin n=1 Tax=Pythium oligandrum TaxID=41045 RepID=A0A8K1FDR8_PYTOL|nr:hypothetical protein Poli38472_010225 [Pythium oligandrum]|eukprot:TMW58666.1 hypothetical protein Poli38472_010225 [Pythium oligandrum]
MEEAIMENEEAVFDMNTIHEETGDEHAVSEAPEPTAVAVEERVASARTQLMRPLTTERGEMSDWIECVNEEGDVYYCNLTTGATTWEPPFPLATVPAQHHGASLPHTQSSHEEVDGDQHQPSLRLVKRALDGSLRRLDPHAQMQLEEARRRHRELEELRDDEVLMGGEHWIEMYDPTHDGFYFYGINSGEMRWDRPDSYVMKVENDDILRMVVRLQCAFRMKLARRKVFRMKVQHGLASGENTPFSSPWVEVYDPFHRVLYYYSATTGETRWDPPEHFISAAEDREMAAAIAIQSMSRSHMARRDVKRRRTALFKIRQEKAAEETRRLREIRRREYLAKTDEERESICRREMLDEEMEQVQEGDLFWGVDKHDQEVLRQQMEERLLYDAECFWHRVNVTLRQRTEQERQRNLEEDTERRELELLAEARERDGMSAAEQEQCSLNDCFWGIQAEEWRQIKARQDLADEEEQSREYAAQAQIEGLQYEWAESAERLTEWTKRNAVVQEKKNQRQYFKWFYHQCTSADQLLDYLWPNKQRYVPPSPVKDAPQSTQKPQPNTMSPAKTRVKKAAATDPPVSYVLDDIVLRSRLIDGYRFDGKSLLTVHDPSNARIEGRRGQYVVSHLDTERVYAAAAAKADKVPRNTLPRRPVPASSKRKPPRIDVDEASEEEERSYSHLHYQRPMTPDPHLPARYNGVPFRSSELSPTREILLSDHSKLTQLPSLAIKPKALQKPQKRSVSPTHQSNNQKPKKLSLVGKALRDSNRLTEEAIYTTLAFASPFARQNPKVKLSVAIPETEEEAPEERARRKAEEKAKRVRDKLSRQFQHEELEVVRHVFELMDADDSGTVNKKEMMWALQRDNEVHSLAKRSLLLRVLLKQQAPLETLFEHVRKADGRGEEVTWVVFQRFCEEVYIRLKEQGLLEALVGEPRQDKSSIKKKKKARVKAKAVTKGLRAPEPKKPAVRYVEEREEALIRRVFELCDRDGNGVLDMNELQDALYTSPLEEIQALVRASTALQPLLQQDLFIKAFKAYEPADRRGISASEFVVFCLEVAEIAVLNGML